MVRVLTATLALALAAQAGPALAQAEQPADAELARLRQEVQDLRGALQRLDADLARLAACRAPGPSTAPATTTPEPLGERERTVLHEQARAAEAAQAWLGMHTGMPKDKVRELLGRPQSEFTVGNRTGWYYTYPPDGAGSVFFDRDGLVVSLQAPRQGTFGLR